MSFWSLEEAIESTEHFFYAIYIIMPKRYGRTVDMPKLFLNEGDVPRAIQLFEQLMFPNGFQHRHLRNGNLVQFLQAFRLRNAVVNQNGIQRFHV